MMEFFTEGLIKIRPRLIEQQQFRMMRQCKSKCKLYCTLVVTLEPCPMCAGACLQTHIGRIVFGAWDAKLGACGSVWDIPRDPHVGLVPEVIGGVREAECGRLMTDFFARRR